MNTSSYDLVGAYSQDKVNGFSSELIEAFLEHVDPQADHSILDAMAGDGNLTVALLTYCAENNIPFPKMTLLELSKVQCAFARESLHGKATVLEENILQSTLWNTFNTVMLKSGNHEIPFESQSLLYKRIFSFLKPGGVYVNLGILLDDEGERDEVREIARIKDTLAGLPTLVCNRHFLTRDEFYSRLNAAGFTSIRCARSLHYTVNSRVVAENYFPEQCREEYALHYQIQHIKSMKLRQNNRIVFTPEGCSVLIPGEITIAQRPY